MPAENDNGKRVELELVACDLCGGPDHEVLLRSADANTGVPGVFTLVKCRTCGLVFQNPRPTPATLRYCYPDQYAPYQEPAPVAGAPVSGLPRRITSIRNEIAGWDFGMDDSAQVKESSRLLRALITLHARYLRYPLYPDAAGEGRLLDIGCGSGRFLNQMTLKGWIADGLEMSPDAAEIAQRQTRGRVTVGLEEDFDVPSDSYDLVTMSHVLEHVPSPKATMLRVYRMLKPGGWLISIVPNIESASARLFGARWIGIDVPRHLYHFSPASLRRVVESSGLLVRAVGTRIVAPMWTYSWLAQRGRDLLPGPFDGPMHRAAPWLLAPLAHVGRGDVVVIRAQKV